MKSLTYTLYAVNKATNNLTKLAEGTRGEMGPKMNQMRHINSKDNRYALYCGNTFVSATNN